MMTSISGELGAGKTYFLAKHLYQAKLAGCYCVANFNHIYAHTIIQNDRNTLLELIRQIAVLKQMGGEMTDILPTFNHTGIFIAIDEAHLVFGRDATGEEMEKVILPFISLARKEDVHIEYVCQDPGTIHKTFRRYTQFWVRVRPVFKLFKTKFTPHETRNIWRRERRLVFPYVFYETHKLDYENPVFSIRTAKDEQGFTYIHEQSTIQSKTIHKNNDPFYHGMYSSNEMSGVITDKEASQGENFELLKKVDFIPNTYFKDPMPTFRRIFKKIGINLPYEPKIPKRQRVVDWSMSDSARVERPRVKPQETAFVNLVDLIKNPTNNVRSRFPRTFIKMLEHRSQE